MLELLRTPRALQFPRTDLNPPFRAPVQPRLRVGAARRQTRGKRGRAGGRAPEPDWRGRDALGSARSPALKVEEKPGLTHPRAASPKPGQGPRMWGAGTGANPRPPPDNLSPARACGSNSAPVRQAPYRLRPETRRPVRSGSNPTGLQPQRGRRPQSAPSPPLSSSSSRFYCSCCWPRPPLSVSRTRQLRQRHVRSVISLILAASS